MLNVLLCQWRWTRSIHLVEKLSDDGVQTAPALGVVSRVAVQLSSRPDEVEPRSSLSYSPPTPCSASTSKLHSSKVKDKVLESVLQGSLVHPEVLRSLGSGSVRWCGTSRDPDSLAWSLSDTDGSSKSPARRTRYPAQQTWQYGL